MQFVLFTLIAYNPDATMGIVSVHASNPYVLASHAHRIINHAHVIICTVGHAGAIVENIGIVVTKHHVFD